MTHKEKAEELVEKMSFDFDMCKGQNIKCALIAVDEIIKDQNGDDSTIGNKSWWWQQIKNEIENL